MRVLDQTRGALGDRRPRLLPLLHEVTSATGALITAYCAHRERVERDVNAIAAILAGLRVLAHEARVTRSRFAYRSPDAAGDVRTSTALRFHHLEV